MLQWICINSNKYKNLFNNIHWYHRKSCRLFNSQYNVNNNKTDIDLYAVLNVKTDATQKQIKTSYFKLSLLLHPDKNINSVASHDKFSQLAEAYKVLGNVKSRRVYDRSRNVSPISSKVTVNFHVDDLKRHKITSRQYDTWTQMHYSKSIGLRDDRLKRDRLRNFESDEDKEGRKSRYVIGALLFFLFIPYVYTKRNKEKNYKI